MSDQLASSSRLLPALIAMLIAAGAAGQRIGVQDSAASAAKDLQKTATAAPKDSAQAKRLDEMRQIARTFQTVRIDQGKRTAIPLSSDPLERWNDPTRAFSDGTLWVWRSSGRPVAVLTIEMYPNIWSFEFVSLSTGLVESGDGRLLWAPRKAGIEFKEVPGAPVPAAGEADRLRQIRDLLKRFSAQEFWDQTSQDYPLRLLSHPIDRYADADSGLVDGAIFVYANGTNPEVLLLLEARRRGPGSSAWFCAAAPLTCAAPTLKLDKQPVWTSPNRYGHHPHDTYFFVQRDRH